MSKKEVLVVTTAAPDVEVTMTARNATETERLVSAMADVINAGPAWLEADRKLINAGFTAAEINQHRDAAIALAASKEILKP